MTPVPEIPSQGIHHLHNHKVLLLELQRAFIPTNFVHKDNAYTTLSQNLKNHFKIGCELSKIVTPASNDYTVILSYFDETRCFGSLKAWIDFYKDHCKRLGVLPQRLIAIVSDLSYLYPEFGWDTNISEYNGCELLYVNYSNKIYLSNKFNKMRIRSQAWEPEAEQILFLPGHMLNLPARMELLEDLRAEFGHDKIKYTLNVPDPHDKEAWDTYRPRIPKDMSFTEWKDYLLRSATNFGDGEGVNFKINQNMTGVDMPGEIYNNTFVQIMGQYNHRALTEKLPRAILNDMPVFFQFKPGLECMGYMRHEYNQENLSELRDNIEDIRSQPNLIREMLDYNKNLLNTHGEEFYKYLDEKLSGKLEVCFLEGGLFSHAM